MLATVRKRIEARQADQSRFEGEPGPVQVFAAIHLEFRVILIRFWYAEAGWRGLQEAPTGKS